MALCTLEARLLCRVRSFFGKNNDNVNSIDTRNCFLSHLNIFQIELSYITNVAYNSCQLPEVLTQRSCYSSLTLAIIQSDKAGNPQFLNPLEKYWSWVLFKYLPYPLPSKIKGSSALAIRNWALEGTPAGGSFFLRNSALLKLSMAPNRNAWKNTDRGKKWFRSARLKVK